MEPKKVIRVEKLEATSSESAKAEQLVTNMLGVQKTAPKIGPVGRSSLLSKVKQFLPEMQEANRRLSEAPCAEDLDIEKISQQHKDNYIEFNLGYADLEREDLKVLREIADQRNSSTSDSDSDSSEVDAEVKTKNTKSEKKLITEMT